MIPESAKAVADAVLYEGFMLYPYRTTSLKNAQRWTFGGLNPRACCIDKDPASGWCQQTEFLVLGSPATRLTTTMRFLHLSETAIVAGNAAALERVVSYAETELADITAVPRLCEFSFPDDDQARAEAAYTEIAGQCELSAEPLGADLFRVRLRVSNFSRVEDPQASTCGVYPQTMAAVHAVCCVSDGKFLSLTDPPESYQAAARSCHSLGAWPILLGQPGESKMLLCSPIIMSDYPQIAQASPGDLFDGTEIDEILTLRIRTLTVDEKHEIQNGDERVRRLLQRSDSLSSEQLLSLHAQMRPPHRELGGMSELPAQFGEKPLTATTLLGVVLRAGDQVRLLPSAQADAFDMLLREKSAIIESIEQDFEGRTMLTVTLLDDPGRDLGMAAKPGHRFFFRPDEVELELPAEVMITAHANNSTKPILVAGIGNIFLGDDGFGVEVVRRLAQSSWPQRVRIVDFGIRSTDLAFALFDDYAAAILIDAVARDGAPGTLYVLEPTLDAEDLAAPFPQGHAATPQDVIRWARTLGATLPPIKIIGCEPAYLEAPDDGEFGLSPQVSDSIEAAVRIIGEIIAEYLT